MKRLGIAALVVLSSSSCARKSVTRPRLSAPQRLSTSRGVDLYPTFSPDGKKLAFASDRSGRFEIYVRDLASGTDKPLTSDGKQNFQPAFSPDGRSIAYHSKDRGGIWVVPSGGGEPTFRTSYGSQPSWSPDGALIAFQSQGLTDVTATGAVAVAPSTIETVPSRGGPTRNLTSEGVPAGGHGRPLFSADAKRLYFVTGNPEFAEAELWSYTFDGARLTKVLTHQRLYDPVLSPDGRSLFWGGVSGTFEYGLWTVDLDSNGLVDGPPAPVLVRKGGVARSPAVAADGRLAFADLNTSARIWSLPLTPGGDAAGAPRPLTSMADGRSTWPIYSPDGSRIAFGHEKPGAKSDLYFMSSAGGEPVRLTDDPGGDWGQSWFPDGKRILMISDRTKRSEAYVLDVASKGVTPLPALAPGAALPRLSPDGTRIAYQSKAGGVTLNTWVVSVDGSGARQLTFDRHMFAFPCWSPDGKWIAAEARRGEDVHVVLISSAGGTPEQLTFGRGLSWAFGFAPDSDRVVFAGLRDSLWNLYWVSRTTKEVRRLTSSTKLNAYYRYPDWSPTGGEIAYEYAETDGSLWIASP